MTDVITCITNKLCSTTKEGICTRSDNDSFSLTLFDSRTRKDLIACFFTNR
jgi:hypothetical protein